MKKSTNYLFLIISIMLCSCASSYKPVNPPSQPYGSAEESAELAFSYQYDVLLRAGNKKYDRREKKKGVRVVAIKLKNNTERTLIPARDIHILANEKVLPVMAPFQVKNTIKQQTPIYLLYLLLTPLSVRFYESNNGVLKEKSTIPVGLVVGPGLTAVNMAVAGSANKKLEAELLEYAFDKPVAPGQTMYALVGLNLSQHHSLSVRVKDH